MADNTAPELPPPPFYLMKSKYEFDCADPPATMEQLRDYLSSRPDSVISWKPQRWYKFKLFVFGGQVYSNLIISLYHIEGTKNVIEVHRTYNDRIEYTVLSIIKKILSGEDASEIRFVDHLKPLPVSSHLIKKVESEEEVERGWHDLMNMFSSPYVENYREGMKAVLTFANERTPPFALTILSKDLTGRSHSDSTLQSQILYLFMNNPVLWEKLEEDEQTAVNSFVTTTLSSLTPDNEQHSYMSQLMLKKVAVQFREAYPLST